MRQEEGEKAVSGGTGLSARLDLPSGLPTKTLDFEWNGMGFHLAPDGATPLSRALMKKTNSALCTLGAGCLLWSAKRLEFIADVQPLLSIAEVLLLWEDDPRYYHHPGELPDPDPAPVTYDVVNALFYQTSKIMEEFPNDHISDPPVQTVENLFALTRHILGEEWTPSFRSWTKRALATMERLAQNPHQDFRDRFDFESDAEFAAYTALNMGRPIAIEVCNQGLEFSVEMSDAAYLDFMMSVKREENCYLATPEMMRVAGFVGEPFVPRLR